MTTAAYIQRVVTPPATPAATLAQLKAHARIETTDEDATELPRLLLAATAAVENECRGLALVDRTMEALVTDPYSAVGELVLPVRPARTLTQVATYSSAGAATVLTLSDYVLRPDGIVVVADGTITWPRGTRLWGALGVQYVAGYGTVDDVPDELQQAVLALATYWYDNREASTARHLPDSVVRACDPFRRFDLARRV